MGDLREEVVKDMTPRLIGETYLRKPTETSRQRYSFGVYECQYCGKEFEAMPKDIKRGHTKSCGCQSARYTNTHRLSRNRFYDTWRQMLQRCTNPKNKNYKNYGGRGITVCEEWLDIRNFVEWAKATHPNVEGYSLDRIDNDKGYSPENCRWADATTQRVNQRMRRTNTSGYVGICWHRTHQVWVAYISVKSKWRSIGTFKTIEEAVIARDNYIIENKLPHKLSTDYIKQGKINE